MTGGDEAKNADKAANKNSTLAEHISWLEKTLHVGRDLTGNMIEQSHLSRNLKSSRLLS